MVLVAVEGCGHGTLDSIYRSLKPMADVLIICGDFQAIRNITDLETISVPSKYKQLGDFPEYYAGTKKAPVLTIFIGGNHECSSYLRELQYGGWVAPNIYYLGEFGSIWYKGIRISGMLGIWNSHTFYQKTTPKYLLPYNPSTLRLAYHVKPKNLLKLLLSGSSDAVISHDWPQWIWQYGDERGLLRKKKFFKDDMKSGELGSPAARAALERLTPPHWFSLHLHVKFTAQFEKTVSVEDNGNRMSLSNSDEISLDMDSNETREDTDADSNKIELDMDGDNGEIQLDMEDKPKKFRKLTRTTSFLALDKCLPRREFLAFVNIDPQDHPSVDSDLLFYDPQALAAQKVVESFIKKNGKQWLGVDPQVILDAGTKSIQLVEELEEKVIEQTKKYQGLDLEVPLNFQRVAPSISENKNPPLQYWPNPQTELLSEKFELPLPSHI